MASARKTIINAYSFSKDIEDERYQALCHPIGHAEANSM